VIHENLFGKFGTFGVFGLFGVGSAALCFATSNHLTQSRHILLQYRALHDRFPRAAEAPVLKRDYAGLLPRARANLLQRAFGECPIGSRHRQVINLLPNQRLEEIILLICAVQ
jgi:hypothetical protein